MLTHPDDIRDAAARLIALGVSQNQAESFVARLLDAGTWDALLERARSGCLSYPDTWVLQGQKRWETGIRDLAQQDAIPSLQGLSMLDLLRPRSALSEQDAAGLEGTDLIRRVAAVSSPYLLFPLDPRAHSVGSARKSRRAEGNFVFDAMSGRLPLPPRALLRADAWSIGVESSEGPVAAMNGHLFSPVKSGGVDPEDALLAIHGVSAPLLCETLSIVGTLPKGRITYPVASVDYLYVAPRARGNRLTAKMSAMAAQLLQRTCPAFGEFLVDPKPLIKALQFPLGIQKPGKEQLQHHLEHRLLVQAVSELASCRGVGVRKRSPLLPLSHNQVNYLVDQLRRGEKLVTLRIPADDELPAEASVTH